MESEKSTIHSESLSADIGRQIHECEESLLRLNQAIEKHTVELVRGDVIEFLEDEKSFEEKIHSQTSRPRSSDPENIVNLVYSLLEDHEYQNDTAGFFADKVIDIIIPIMISRLEFRLKYLKRNLADIVLKK